MMGSVRSAHMRTCVYSEGVRVQVDCQHSIDSEEAVRCTCRWSDFQLSSSAASARMPAKAMAENKAQVGEGSEIADVPEHQVPQRRWA